MVSLHTVSNHVGQLQKIALEVRFGSVENSAMRSSHTIRLKRETRMMTSLVSHANVESV